MNSQHSLDVFLADEAEMVAFGQQLGNACQGDGTIFLIGNLGMGKTTLCRGVLRSQGYSGAVKSPTYTLVEPYEFDDSLIYHFDLYRLADPEELEYLGIRDYFSVEAIRLIEWPDQGRGILASPDMAVEIEVEGTGRSVSCQAKTERGESILQRLQAGIGQ